MTKSHFKYKSHSDNPVELIFSALPLDSREAKEASERRKKYKEDVGATHPDTLMVDTKLGPGATKEFCDAILITRNLAKWMSLMHAPILQSKGLTPTEREVVGGL